MDFMTRMRSLESRIIVVGVRVAVLIATCMVLASLVHFIYAGARKGEFWMIANVLSTLVVFSFSFVALVLLCLKRCGVSKERVIAAAEMADLV